MSNCASNKTDGDHGHFRIKKRPADTETRTYTDLFKDDIGPVNEDWFTDATNSRLKTSCQVVTPRQHPPFTTVPGGRSPCLFSPNIPVSARKNPGGALAVHLRPKKGCTHLEKKFESPHHIQPSGMTPRAAPGVIPGVIPGMTPGVTPGMTPGMTPRQVQSARRNSAMISPIPLPLDSPALLKQLFKSPGVTPGAQSTPVSLAASLGVDHLGGDRTNLSWSSSLATPPLSTSTYSLLDSTADHSIQDVRQPGVPRVLFSPDGSKVLSDMDELVESINTTSEVTGVFNVSNNCDDFIQNTNKEGTVCYLGAKSEQQEGKNLCNEMTETENVQENVHQGDVASKCGKDCHNQEHKKLKESNEQCEPKDFDCKSISTSTPVGGMSSEHSIQSPNVSSNIEHALSSFFSTPPCRSSLRRNALKRRTRKMKKTDHHSESLLDDLLHVSQDSKVQVSEHNMQVSLDGSVQLSLGGKQQVTQDGNVQVSQDGKEQVTPEDKVHISLDGKMQVSQNKKVQSSKDGKLQTLQDGKVRMQISQDGSVQLSQDGKMQVTQDGKMQVTQDGKMQVTQDGKLQMSQDAIMQMSQNAKMPILQDDQVHVSQNGKVQISQNGKVQISQNGKVQMSQYSKVHASQDGNVQVPHNEKMQVSQNDKVQVSQDGKLNVQEDKICGSENFKVQLSQGNNREVQMPEVGEVQTSQNIELQAPLVGKVQMSGNGTCSKMVNQKSILKQESIQSKEPGTSKSHTELCNNRTSPDKQNNEHLYVSAVDDPEIAFRLPTQLEKIKGETINNTISNTKLTVPNVNTDHKTDIEASSLFVQETDMKYFEGQPLTKCASAFEVNPLPRSTSVSESEAIFSQLSPTSLSAMCLAADKEKMQDSSTSFQEKKSSLNSEFQESSVYCCHVKEPTIKLGNSRQQNTDSLPGKSPNPTPKSKLHNIVKIKKAVMIEMTKSSTNPLFDPPVSVPQDRGNKKAKKFFYPTSSQISADSPTKVYSLGLKKEKESQESDKNLLSNSNTDNGMRNGTSKEPVLILNNRSVDQEIESDMDIDYVDIAEDFDSSFDKLVQNKFELDKSKDEEFATHPASKPKSMYTCRRRLNNSSTFSTFSSISNTNENIDDKTESISSTNKVKVIWKGTEDADKNMNICNKPDEEDVKSWTKSPVKVSDEVETPAETQGQGHTNKQDVKQTNSTNAAANNECLLNNTTEQELETTAPLISMPESVDTSHNRKPRKDNEINFTMNIKDSSMHSDIEPNAVIGFMSASGKNINITAKALQKAEKLLSEDDGQENPRSRSIPTSEIKSTPDVSSEQPYTQLDSQMEHKFCGIKSTPDVGSEQPYTQLDSQVEHKFCCFKTARGNDVSISDMGLQKAKQLLDSFEMQMSTDIDISRNSKSHGATRYLSDSTQNKPQGDTNPSSYQECLGISMGGFKSAGGKDIHVSKKQLETAAKLLETDPYDAVINDRKLQCTNDTADSSDKSVLVVQNQNEKTDHYIGVSGEPISSIDLKGFMGFKSASEKTIQISDKALRKASLLLEDVNTSPISFPSTTSNDSNHNQSKDMKAQLTISEIKNVRSCKGEVLPTHLSTNQKVSQPVSFTMSKSKTPAVKDYSKLPKGFRPFKPPRLIPKNEGKESPKIATAKPVSAENRIMSHSSQDPCMMQSKSRPKDSKDRRIPCSSKLISYEAGPANSPSIIASGGPLIEQAILNDIQGQGHVVSSNLISSSRSNLISSSRRESEKTVENGEQSSVNTPKQQGADLSPGENSEAFNDSFDGDLPLTQLVEVSESISALAQSGFSQWPSTQEKLEGDGKANVGHLQDVKAYPDLTQRQPVKEQETENESFQNDSQAAVPQPNSCLSQSCISVKADVPNRHQDVDGDKLLAFQGFQTAAGQKVTVSEAALQKAKATLGDLDLLDKECKRKTTSGTNAGKVNVDIQQVDEEQEYKPRGTQPLQTQNHIALDLSRMPLDLQNPSLQNVCQVSKISPDVQNSSLQDIPKISSVQNCGRELNTKSGDENRPAVSGCGLQEVSKSPASFDGFHTAGGKKVVISTEALALVKQKFADCDGLLETNCDKRAQTSNKARSVQSIPAFALQSADNIYSRESSCEHVSKVTKNLSNNNDCVQDAFDFKEQSFSGFRTASGNLVYVSEEAVLKAKQTLSECEEESSLNSTKQVIFKGFQTAGGKVVSVSKEAIKAVKRKFAEFNDDDENDILAVSTVTSPECALSDENTNEKEAKQTELLPSDKNEHRKLVTPDKASLNVLQKPFLGFHTASGNHVSVSENALKRAREKLGDDAINVIEPAHAFGNEKLTSVCVFQTASGNSVPVSDKALKKARKMLADDATLGQQHTGIGSTSKSACVFKTASGNSVPVFDKALKKAREMLADDATFEQPHTSTSKTSKPACQFQTASGNSVPVSDKALKMARQKLADYELSTSPKCLPLVNDVIQKPTSVFQTGSGDHVSVSDEALKMARNFLADNKCNESNTIQHTSVNKESSPTCLFQTASGNHVSVSDKALKMAREKLAHDVTFKHKHSISNEKASPACLFQTASGSHVPVSDKALKMARKLLADDGGPFPDVPTAVHQAISDAEGVKSKAACIFQITSGNKIDVSSVSLASAEKLLETNGVDVPVPTTAFRDTESSNLPSPFQTASGSSVNVSPKSIAAAQRLLDIELELTSFYHQMNERKNSYLTTPFHTASGSKIAVSAEAVAKAKEYLDEDEDVEGKKLRIAPDQCSAVSKFDLRNESPTFDDLETTETIQALLSDGAFDDWTPTQQIPIVTTPEGVLEDRQTSSPVLSAPCQDNGNKGLRWDLPKNRQKFKERAYKSRALPVKTELKHVQNAAFNSVISPYKSDTQQTFRTPLKENTKSPSLDNSGVKNQSTFITPYKQNISSSKSFSVDKAGKNKRSASPEFQVPMKRQRMEIKSDDDTNQGCSDDMTLRKRQQARLDQRYAISQKKKQTIQPIKGQLSVKKSNRNRVTWKESGRQPQTYTKDELLSHGVLLSTLGVASHNAEMFRFLATDHFSEALVYSGDNCKCCDGAEIVLADDKTCGVQEICSAFLASPGVDPHLTSPEWVQNHYRWIVWKLAAMEANFPEQCGLRCLTPEQVLLQLKYRYDREVDNTERSCLKKILERDDTPCKTMILCVSSTMEIDQNIIELSDGWYSVKSLVDPPMKAMVKSGRLGVGQKVVIHGAELVGPQDACSPLEVPADLKLKICTNSTRPARWDAKLGFYRHPQPFPVPLSSLKGDGGATACVDVVIVRVYPLQFLEKFPDGSTVFRNARAEERASRKFQQTQQQKIESIYSRLQSEMERSEQQAFGSRNQKSVCLTSQQIEQLCTGQEIYEALQEGRDPDAVEMSLSMCQLQLLNDYRRSLQDKRATQLQEKLQKALENAEGQAKRSVTPVLKVKVAGCRTADIDNRATSLLTVWRPSEEVQQLLQEGRRLKILNTTASFGRSSGGSVCLSSTKATRYIEQPLDENLKDLVYEPREPLPFCDLSQQIPGKEVDVIGVVVQLSGVTSWEKQSGTSGSLQTVYMCDDNEHLCAVKVWGGLQSHCVEDLLTVGSVVSIQNLQIRCDVRSSIMTLYCTDLTHFTTRPRMKTSYARVQQLQTHSKNSPGYLQHMANTLLSINQGHSVGFESPDMRSRSPGNRQQVQSGRYSPFPTPPSRHDNKQTTGLNSHQTDSPSMPSLRDDQQRAQRNKALKLEAYEEPPPLLQLTSPIPQSVRRGFKPPGLRLGTDWKKNMKLTKQNVQNSKEIDHSENVREIEPTEVSVGGLSHELSQSLDIGSEDDGLLANIPLHEVEQSIVAKSGDPAESRINSEASVPVTNVPSKSEFHLPAEIENVERNSASESCNENMNLNSESVCDKKSTSIHVELAKENETLTSGPNAQSVMIYKDKAFSSELETDHATTQVSPQRDRTPLKRTRKRTRSKCTSPPGIDPSEQTQQTKRRSLRLAKKS